MELLKSVSAWIGRRLDALVKLFRPEPPVDLDDLSNQVVLTLMQSWGQTADEKLKVLNAAVAACGIKATFQQGPNGENAGWRYKDEKHAQLSAEFRKKINSCWRGEFQAEAQAVRALIHEFRSKV